MKITFIGLGTMGVPMAGHLAVAGHELTVYDIRKDATEAFVTKHSGTIAARSLQDAAQDADVVITILPTSSDVRAAMFGANGDAGLAAGMKRGAILVDMTSGNPIETRQISEKLAEQGVTMLDAPVSGGLKGAVAARLAIMIGGPAAAFETVGPLLERMGSRLFHVGDVGAGQAMKALNNFVSAAGLVAAGEAIAIGSRFGLDPALMIDILNASTGRNNSTENKFKPFVLSGSFAGGFALRLMAKDLGIAADLADATELPGELNHLCSDLWQRAAEALPADADHTAIVRWLGFDPTSPRADVGMAAE